MTNDSSELISQLRATLGKMETALGAISNGIVWTDEAGNIQWCNTAFDRLVGHRHLDVLGAKLIDLLPLQQDEERLSPEAHPVNLSLRGQAKGRGYYGCSLGSQEMRLDISWFRIEFPEHEKSSVLVIWDITEQERLNGERKRQAAELDRREKVMLSLLDDIQAAKGHIDEQKRILEAANKKLQELSALKDQFVANVSHELRTPLTTIKEGVNLMLDQVLGGVSQQQRDFLKIVDTSVDRLTELISNMLDLSKIEAGRMKMVRRPVALQELIRTTVRDYGMLAGKRTLKTELPPVPDVFADPSRILQVLVNLFSNAVKFTKEDGTITFSLREEKGEVAVSVVDDGIGISKEEQSRLFQKFSQVGQRENRPTGTGLGLVLSKDLVELHKGKITFESTPGKGSTFTFTLPVYTPWFALEDSFLERVDSAKREPKESVAVIAVDIETLKGEQSLDEITETIRKQVHYEDGVVGIEPHWVIILALADREGGEAISRRLERAIPSVHCRMTVYPSEAKDFIAVLDQVIGGSWQQSIRSIPGKT